MKNYVEAISRKSFVVEIRSMVKTIELPQKERIKFLEKKLEKCRNEQYNPDSVVYRQRMKKIYDDEDLEVISTGTAKVE